MGCLESCIKGNKKKKDERQNNYNDIENQDSFTNMTPQQRGEFYKEFGNNFYRQKQFQKAIEQYTKAIKCNDQVTLYYSNRAICMKFTKNWFGVIQNCEKAIQLDNNNFKAYNYLGIALVQLGQNKHDSYQQQISQIDDGIQKLMEGLKIYKEIGKTQLTIIRSYEKNIRRAQFIKWRKQHQKDQEQKRDQILMIEDLLQNHEDKDNLISEIKTEYISPPEDPNKYQTVPEYLNCPMGFEIMDEPTIIQSGFSYNKNLLEDHFNKNGDKDPITRKPVNARVKIENKSLKQAISDFKDNNPWHYEVDNFDDEEIQE